MSRDGERKSPLPSAPRTWSEEAAEAAPHPGASPEARYVIRGELGRGGMGEVIRVADTRLDREVALKRIASATPNAAEISRFVREATVTGKLAHPGIVPVHDLGFDEAGRPWFTMKVVEGPTLEQLLRARLRKEAGAPTLYRLVDAFRRVCETIAFAHDRGVLHRDLKPSNIMVGAFGEVLVLDWGIARSMTETDPDTAAPSTPTPYGTRVGVGMGTPGFMSPEQQAGAWNRLDARADVWALGAVLNVVLTGEPPGEGPLPPGPEVPGELAAIVARATARDPADRYPDAAALARDVEAWEQGLAVTAYRYSLGETLRRYARRHRAPLVVAAVALGVLSAAAVVSVQRLRSERDRAVVAERSVRDGLLAALSEGAARAWDDRAFADAALLAAAAFGEEPSPESLGLLVAAEPRITWALQAEWSVPFFCAQVRFAADGSRLVCGASTRGARIWNVPDGREVWASDDSVALVGVSASGRELAFEKDPAGVRGVDADGRALGEVQPCATGVNALQPLDGGRVAVGCLGGGGGVWSYTSGLVQAFDFPAEITGLALDPAGDLVLAGPGGVAVVHEAGKVERLAESFATPHRLRLSPAGDLLVAAGMVEDRAALAWRWPSVAPVYLPRGHTGEVFEATVGAGGRVWSASADGAVIGSDPDRGELVERFTEHRGALPAMDVTADGAWMATVGQVATSARWRGAADEPSQLRLWRRQVDEAAEITIASPGAALLRVCGPHLLAGTLSGEVVIDGRSAATTGAGAIRSISCAGAARAVVANVATGVWSIDLDSAATTQLDVGGLLPQGLAVLPAGRLALGMEDGSLRIMGSAVTPPYASTDGPLDQLLASPDGALLFGAWDTNEARLFNSHDLSLNTKLETRGIALSQAEWSPDGTLVALSSREHGVRIWRVSDGGVVRDILHPTWVGAIGWSPDGRWLALGDHGGEVRVVDVDTGADVLRLPWQGGRIRGVRFSTDGRALYAAASGQPIRRFDVTHLGEPAAEASARLTRRLGMAVEGGGILVR